MRGNVTTLGNIGFVYDYSDQPVHVSGGVNGTYTYDGNKRRVKSVVDGKTIYYVYDAAGNLIMIDNKHTDRRTEYIKANGKNIARIDAGKELTYLHNDHLGSASTGTNSTIKWRENYTPFGISLNNPAAQKDHAGYTGHIKDNATGLNYMQARYYDPVLSRFLSTDPIGFPPSTPKCSTAICMSEMIRLII